ncbi:MAG: GDP-mannose-dependent alpha-(1-6)-phosphatidylinositol monomannoside mannosyltransferase [Chloroflexi bacterium ADurb.Bin180]|nr:MAG: GDP-mannose-dependent alpha-(1-6)-phosphatidylinositol monomannoside mannosyltransferase [Chloroflexi bacterium ADurb.Bin180]
MRIAFVGPFALQPKRTMAVRALPLARALVQRGHEVCLVLPPWDWPADSGRACDDGGVQIQNVRLPAPVPLLAHAELTRRLVHATLNQQPDLIHCFKPKAYAGLAAWTLWQLRRVGLGRAALFVDSDDWEGAGGWNSLMQYTALQRRLFAWQEKWGLTHHDGLTVASRALESIAWSLGVPKDKILYLPNGGRPAPQAGPDELAAARQRLGIGSAPVALLYTRFFEFSLDRVVELMQGVWQQVPEVHWLVVGQGLFGEERELEQRVAALAPAGHFHYAGWVQEDKLPAVLALANVAIYPFDDNLVNRCKCPVKLTDLMGAGVPVVADRVGQIAEYIVPGESGLLSPPGDTGNLVSQTVDLLRNPDRASRIGQEGKRRIGEEFGWERLAQQVEAFYLRNARIKAGGAS